MTQGLKDGTAIVTGGATLIGQAVVRAFTCSAASAARRSWPESSSSCAATTPRSSWGRIWAADGGYSAMGPEQAEPAIPKLME